MESRKDLEVCGEATNGEEAARKSLEVNPELIILDVTMPVLDGFSAARKIKEAMPAVPILMLSMHTIRRWREVPGPWERRDFSLRRRPTKFS